MSRKNCHNCANLVFNLRYGLVALISLVMIIGCKSKETTCTERLDSFAATVTASVDLNELMEWATTNLQFYSTGKELTATKEELTSTNMPFALLNIEKYPPAIIVVQLDEPKEKVIQIDWRTYYGGKGILIGSPTAQLMKWSDHCKRELKPGIVIYCSTGD